MSQVWIPWQDNPERYKLRGLKAVVWTPLLLAYRVFKRFPAAVFFGAALVVCLLVWAHALLFAYVEESFLINPLVNNPALHSWFGGELTLAELRIGLADQGSWLCYPLYPLGHEFVRDLLAMGGIIGIVSIIPLYCIWWERKVSAHIQSRVGPMRVGGWHGWTQTVADGVKLIAKEDFVPKEGDGPLFRLAPYLAFVPSIMAFIALPFGAYWVFRNSDVGLVLILALLGVEVMSVIVAGWASNNKWSVYGAMREACQMVSYEIPLAMALLLPVMAAGTLNLAVVGQQQSGGWFSWLCFQNPLLFAASLAYYVASLASCKRAPFDLAESESELVAGFHTEYSGFRWSMFFFAEYCAMFVVSGLATILFFGAWFSPIPDAWVQGALDWFHVESTVIRSGIGGLFSGGPLWFIGKCVLLVYVQMWIRWTLPRIRIDQLLYACVQVMLPAMMMLLLGNTVWLLWVDADGLFQRLTTYVLGGLGALLVLSFVVVAVAGHIRRRRLVGYLALDPLPGA